MVIYISDLMYFDAPRKLVKAKIRKNKLRVEIFGKNLSKLIDW